MRKLLGALGGGGGDKAKKKVIRANLGDDSSFYYDEKVRTLRHAFGPNGRRSPPDQIEQTCVPARLRCRGSNRFIR